MGTDKPLRELLCLLADGEVPFVVVGGYAALMHGSSLLTQDLDICAPLGPESVAKLRQLLTPYHPVHRMTPQKLPFAEFPKELSGIHNLYLTTDLGPLDILGLVGGVGDFERLRNQAVEVSLFGRKCLVISLDDLIEAKLFMKRPHDLTTVKQLEWIKKQSG